MGCRIKSCTLPFPKTFSVVPALSLNNCVTLGKSLNLSESQFSHMYKGIVVQSPPLGLL